MPSIRTDRLILRGFVPADAEHFVAYRSDPDVLDKLGSRIPPTVEGTLERIAAAATQDGPIPGEWYRLAIDRDGELAGDVVAFVRQGGGIAEIGYALRPEFRGAGYAQEAAAGLADHLIAAHGIHRVEASLAPDNHASMRVLEAIGMRYETVARDAFCRDGVWEDDLRYAMTAAERAAWVERPRVRPSTVELVEIDPERTGRWRRLATHHSQEQFVATMADTWCDALFPETFEDIVAEPWLRGVLADDVPVAFVMASKNHGSSAGWYLWRLLVDRIHQRRGIGELAVAALAAELRASGVPRLYTSCVEGVAGSPRRFYDRLGFVPTGRQLDEETELVLDLT